MQNNQPCVSTLNPLICQRTIVFFISVHAFGQRVQKGPRQFLSTVRK